MEYTLKCEKIVEEDDVTNLVLHNGLPVKPNGDQSKTGLLVSVSTHPVFGIASLNDFLLQQYIGFYWSFGKRLTSLSMITDIPSSY